MAEIGNTHPSLIDLLSRTESDGKFATILEVLTKQNPMLEDAYYIQANNGTKHRTTIRTGIPEPAYRRFNAGVQPVKSTTASVEDTTGMLAAYNEVDKELAELMGNSAAFRASEAKATMQGFNNKVQRDIFYGSTAVTPEGFMGLAPRFSTKSADSGKQIVDAGGTGNTNASLWFVTWSDQAAHLIYPKGMPVGLQHRDLGEHTKQFTDGSMMQVMRDYFAWHLGLTVRDWEGVARVANIDVNTLTKNAATGADLVDLASDAIELIKPGLMNEGRVVGYAPRRVISFLKRQIATRANVRLSLEEVTGAYGVKRRDLMFDGIPIRQVDELLTTEARVV